MAFEGEKFVHFFYLLVVDVLRLPRNRVNIDFIPKVYTEIIRSVEGDDWVEVDQLDCFVFVLPDERELLVLLGLGQDDPSFDDQLDTQHFIVVHSHVVEGV